MDNNTTKVLQTLTRQINAITSNLIYYDWYYFISNNIKFIIDSKIIYHIFNIVLYIVLYSHIVLFQVCYSFNGAM